MHFEIARTEEFYARAADLHRWLDPFGQRIFGTMVATYRGLLDEMKRLDGDVLSTRVRLSGWRKMRIARFFNSVSGYRSGAPVALARLNLIGRWPCAMMADTRS